MVIQPGVYEMMHPSLVDHARDSPRIIHLTKKHIPLMRVNSAENESRHYLFLCAKDNYCSAYLISSRSRIRRDGQVVTLKELCPAFVKGITDL
jgi:hypothetical protein